MPPTPKTEAPRPDNRYLNRELSLLGFQHRVLEEARNPDNPLLERVKFLAILGSNLDEFAMVRVGGLIMQKRTGIVDRSLDGLLPADQLALLRRELVALLQEAGDLWKQELQPELVKAGIHVLDHAELNPKQQKQVSTQFHESIFPVLTPQAFDPGHPFPHISNLSLNLAVLVRDPLGEERFARIKVPATLPRLVPIKRSSGGERKDGTVPHKHWFVWLEQVIEAHLDRLFPGMEVIHAGAFRVTRNAELAIQELEAADLLQTMSENVRERRFAAVVRLDLDRRMPTASRRILTENLATHPHDVYTLDAPLGLGGLMQLYEIERFDLRDRPFTPAVPPVLRPEIAERSIFATLRQGDVLLHHPYHTFDPVIDFLKAAARDPDVLAIKQTLYRVGRNSPVVKYLLEARREHRKQVTVLVELKARFDEESNIGWARMLEREGVHVIYGMVGLKTHAKVLLVVRKEGERLRRYLHLGTGNYNHLTARVYEDMGVLTSDEDLGADASELFNILTGYSRRAEFRKLLVAPLTLREGLMARIDGQIERAQRGASGRIIIKANSLVDQRLIDKLYEASAAGVRIDLIIRGMCCLRPGVADLSENIRVRSIVGRFLEHSRIYCFGEGDEEEILLGSADPMTRNLDRRIETVFPVGDTVMRDHIRHTVLGVCLADNHKARLMAPDGNFAPTAPAPGEETVDAQSLLMGAYRQETGGGGLA